MKNCPGNGVSNIVLNRAHPRGARWACLNKMSSKVTEASIRALAEGALESKENANNLVDLLDYLQVS